MKSVNLLIMFCSFVTVVFSQIQMWSHTYGFTLNDHCFFMDKAFGQGYFLVGDRQLVPSGNREVFLIKTTATGDTVWTRTFSGTNEDFGNCVISTNSGGCILTASTFSFGSGGSEAWIINVDSLGNTVWANTFGASGDDWLVSIVTLEDGGYVATGGTRNYGAQGADLWLVKIDAAGNLVWSKLYGGSGYEAGTEIAPTSDNGFILTAETNSFGSGSWDIWLLKTNASGDTIWTTTLGGINEEYSSSVMQTSDNGYIITGHTQSFGAGLSDLWIVHTDASGDVLWSKTYGGDSNDQGGSIDIIDDTGFIIQGVTQSFGAGDSDIWVLRTDNQGDTLWTVTIGGPSFDSASKILYINGLGYIVGGSTESYGAGGSDAFLVLIGLENINLDSLNNIVINPGFEDGLTYWDPYQYTSGWSTSSSDPHSGLSCAEFSFPGGSGYYDASIRQTGSHLSVVPNIPYKFSFWRREIDTHDTWTTTETILDADLVLNGVNYSHPMPNMAPSNIWTKISKEVVFADSGVVYIDFQLHGYATSNDAVFQLDDVALYPITENLYLTIPNISCAVGDTVLLPIYVDLFTDSIYRAAELRFTGYQNGLDFIGIDTTDAMIGGLDWILAHNEADSLLLTAYAGTDFICGEGVFCNLIFVATGIPCSAVPVECVFAKFNSDTVTNITNGSIYIGGVLSFGDVDENGIVEALDASDILRHLVGLDSLGCQQAINADVDTSGSITALDATIILQYLVQLVDQLPVSSSTPQYLASGSISTVDVAAVPGMEVVIPITLISGENILSFEGEITYDTTLLSPTGEYIEWTPLLSGFNIEVSTQSGRFYFAGASSNPDGSDGELCYLHFLTNETLENTEVLLTIQFNNNIEYDRIEIGVYRTLNSNSDLLLPMKYAIHQNYPNPFNAASILKYDLPMRSNVSLVVYDLRGHEVITLINQIEGPGFKTITWNGRDNNGLIVGSGVYLYHFRAGEFTQTKKMLILK